MSATTRVIRGRVLSFTDDPAVSSSPAYSYIEDGAVLVVGGLIEAVGAARDILARARPDVIIDEYRSSKIKPLRTKNRSTAK